MTKKNGDMFQAGVKRYMGIKLNGISVPIGGISWEYTESGQKGIQEMFYYLESKRLLINPKEMEKKEWSEKSAIEIKNKLVDILSRYKYDQNIITIIKQMVDACNEFLDNMQRVEVRGILYKNLQSDWEDLEYGVAMKKFRKIFRDNIKLLAETYNITFSKEIPKEY